MSPEAIAELARRVRVLRHAAGLRAKWRGIASSVFPAIP
jgi:hypothetical protein